MKNLILILSILSIPFFASANGVLIIKSSSTDFLKLTNSNVDVSINNQIAVVTVRETFVNDQDTIIKVKYGFPMDDDASSTLLRWNLYNTWYTASFSASPQDTTLPVDSGGNANPVVINHLGNTPLYFNIPQWVPKDSTIVVELTYVMLLDYSLGQISFSYPADYTDIQTDLLDNFNLNFEAYSDRNITSVSASESFTTNTSTNNYKNISINANNVAYNKDINIDYTLAPDSLGIIGLSTYFPDSLMNCDSTNGYFAFIIEPNAFDESIPKDFVFIIDKSGSMSGTKMQEAKNAAKYILNNLNSDDRFNIVKFGSTVSSLANGFLNYNATNLINGLSFIGNLSASGGTNISGSFQTALPLFNNSSSSSAQVIIFITDGQATSGITSTSGILTEVNNLKSQHAPDVSINTFGIGMGANQSLLSQLASNNNGISEMLGSQNFSTTITNFYLTIQNPLLLNTTISFNPPIVSQLYPRNLPNLYKGQQLIIVGRYLQADSLEITLSGVNYGNPVSYKFNAELLPNYDPEMSFLSKIWAKKKIEYLYPKYFENSGLAQDSIKDTIIDLSLCYRVLSPFTSFTSNIVNPIGGGGGATVGIEDLHEAKEEEEEVRVSPNPFTDYMHIETHANLRDGNHQLSISFYDISGREIMKIEGLVQAVGGVIQLSHPDLILLPEGEYMFVVEVGGEVFGGRVYKIW